MVAPGPKLSDEVIGRSVRIIAEKWARGNDFVRYFLRSRPRRRKPMSSPD